MEVYRFNFIDREHVNFSFKSIVFFCWNKNLNLCELENHIILLAGNKKCFEKQNNSE